MKPIQMLLSQNQKIFSEFFSTLLESTKQLEYFEKKDESQKLFSSDIINSKKRGQLNDQKTRVRTLMDSEHVKGSEKTAYIWKSVLFSYFLLPLKGNELEKICFSSI